MGGSKKRRYDEITETPDVSHVRNVDVTHERSDVNVTAILKFVVALSVITAVVFGLMWGLVYVLAERKREEPPGPMAMKEEERIPPEPRLQGAPGFGVDRQDGSREDLELMEPQAEYRVLRDQWMQNLEQGSTDESGNVVAIPIDEAINRVVNERTIAERPAEQLRNLEDGAIETPTAASSGRVSVKRRQ